VIQSKLGRHDLAFENAKLAVREFHQSFRTQQALRAKGESETVQFTDVVIHYSIALHNLGIEEHFQHNRDLSILNFSSAFNLAEQNLGRLHPLAQKFKQVYEKALLVMTNFSE